MINPQLIDDMVKRLSAVFPANLQALPTELQQNFRAVLQSMLAQLNLVTREEFDVQVAVLAKTRSKLVALEEQIQQLEKSLGEPLS